MLYQCSCGKRFSQFICEVAWIFYWNSYWIAANCACHTSIRYLNNLVPNTELWPIVNIHVKRNWHVSRINWPIPIIEKDCSDVKHWTPYLAAFLRAGLV